MRGCVAACSRASTATCRPGSSRAGGLTGDNHVDSTDASIGTAPLLNRCMLDRSMAVAFSYHGQAFVLAGRLPNSISWFHRYRARIALVV